MIKISNYFILLELYWYVCLFGHRCLIELWLLVNVPHVYPLVGYNKQCSVQQYIHYNWFNINMLVQQYSVTIKLPICHYYLLYVNYKIIIWARKLKKIFFFKYPMSLMCKLFSGVKENGPYLALLGGLVQIKSDKLLCYDNIFKLDHKGQRSTHIHT